MRSRRPSAETVRRTWRASKGLLRGEDAASDELLLVCSSARVRKVEEGLLQVLLR